MEDLVVCKICDKSVEKKTLSGKNCGSCAGRIRRGLCARCGKKSDSLMQYNCAPCNVSLKKNQLPLSKKNAPSLAVTMKSRSNRPKLQTNTKTTVLQQLVKEKPKVGAYAQNVRLKYNQKSVLLPNIAAKPVAKDLQSKSSGRASAHVIFFNIFNYSCRSINRNQSTRQTK